VPFMDDDGMAHFVARQQARAGVDPSTLVPRVTLDQFRAMTKITGKGKGKRRG